MSSGSWIQISSVLPTKSGYMGLLMKLVSGTCHSKHNLQIFNTKTDKKTGNLSKMFFWGISISLISHFWGISHFSLLFPGFLKSESGFYNRCPNLMNLSRGLNLAKTGFNLARLKSGKIERYLSRGSNSLNSVSGHIFLRDFPKFWIRFFIFLVRFLFLIR